MEEVGSHETAAVARDEMHNSAPKAIPYKSKFEALLQVVSRYQGR
jgi:hypothetical protein